MTDLANPFPFGENDLIRSAFDFASIGMALVGTDGAWLRVNDSVCRITGYTREELLKKTFQDITHPDDLEKDLTSLHAVLDGKISFYEMEKRYFHKKGHIVWILLTVSLVCDEQQKPLFFISQIQDITEKKRLEIELQSRESELRSVLDQTQVVIVRFDRKCRHLYVNSRVKDEIGRPTEEVIGKTFADLGIKDAVSDLIESTVGKVFNEKQAVQIEIENLMKPEASYFYASATPEFDSENHAVETVLFVSVNITKLKNTEFELRQALAEVRQLREILPICSYCKNIRDDKDYWHTVENYITRHTDSKFSHSICPPCYESEIKPQLELLKSRR